MNWKKIIIFGLIILIIKEILKNLMKLSAINPAIIITITTLIIIIITAYLYTKYLENEDTNLKEGLSIGIIWLVIILTGSIIINNIMLEKTLNITYHIYLLFIPIIAIGQTYTKNLELPSTYHSKINLKQTILYGLIICVIFFIIYEIIGLCGIKPVGSGLDLFNTRLFLEIAIFGTIFGILYIKNNPETDARSALIVGVIWMVIIILLDMIIIVIGLIHLTSAQYLIVYPIDYITFPVIMSSLGSALEVGNKLI